MQIDRFRIKIRHFLKVRLLTRDEKRMEYMYIRFRTSSISRKLDGNRKV